ncbi:unnamed protein product [Trichogramma brassicae]|uniref:Guanylate cyclase domain-containing protein n=1 Tax=Trichogramma brassicae TaxID=86971 RepID=A0A6H5JBX0_9HYME|nr:unnamed protein product [Trichogramma brassicae]
MRRDLLRNMFMEVHKNVSILYADVVNFRPDGAHARAEARRDPQPALRQLRRRLGAAQRCCASSSSATATTAWRACRSRIRVTRRTASIWAST